MIRRLLCWIGWHEYINCCEYCKENIEKADCAKCKYFMFPVNICKHCGKIKR